jgi:hypothetical protein
MRRLNLLLFFVCLFASIAFSQQQLDPSNTSGIYPYATFDGTRENVNLATGSMNIRIPLLSLPGRGGLDLNIALLYDSNIHSLQYRFTDGEGDVWWWDNNPSAGWRLNIPKIYWGQSKEVVSPWTIRCIANVVVQTSDGAQHDFKNKAHCERTTGVQQPTRNVSLSMSRDATYMQLETSDTEAILHMPNGSRIYFSPGWQPYQDSGEAYPTKIVDRNGNKITFNTQDGILQSITDSLGRTITLNAGPLTILSYKDSNGSDVSVVATHADGTVSPNFPDPSSATQMATATGPQLTTLSLPGERVFHFEYNTFGELAKVQYPRGGYTRYVYDTFTHKHEQLNCCHITASIRQIIQSRGGGRAGRGCSSPQAAPTK